MLRWDIAPARDEAADLARQAGVSPLTAGVLLGRDIADAEAARAFMQPKMTDLIDPLELPGVEVAACRVAQAVSQGEKIVIYGDYDVDGMTSIAILHACIKMIGGDVSYYVPHRLEEGYGVNPEALQKIIASGAKLIITVDCGITAGAVLGQVDGADVIVTDHHPPPAAGDLPDVAAVVHPALDGHAHAAKNPYLCGAGVAFKLAWQIARQASGQSRVTSELKTFLLNALGLAALGTVADIVPLVGENRVIATFGLRGLRNTTHVGIAALLGSTNVSQAVDTFKVGFVLAPKLNAAGRMGHAAEAVEMLTSDDPARAGEIAGNLARQNSQRQKVQRDIVAQARQMVQDLGLDSPEHRAIVIAGEGWHGGIVGIVAARIVDIFSRPAVVMTLDEQGYAQGSARSVPGFDLARALEACNEKLISHGGHAMAAGLKLRAEDLAEFTEAFGQYARENIDDQQLAPSLAIDAETTLGALDINAVSQLEQLAPFGSKNPRPVLAITGCRILTPARRIGQTGQTVSVVLQQNGVSMRAIGFGMGDLADAAAGVSQCDIAGSPVLNTFNGRTNVEIHLKDVRWDY